MDIESIPGVLACDVGNHAIHLACVKGDEVTPMRTVRVGELSGLGPALAALWREIPPPRKLVACSVNPAALKALEAAAAEATGEGVLVVGRDLPSPIDTSLHNPSATGTDRLCAAAAAFDRLGVACVVADIGTAITIDYVNDEGIFQGGAILPGLDMSARSLQEGTAQLPRVELAAPAAACGKDTRQAILSGLVYGARGALRELAEAYATELGHWPVVILTGGDAALVAGDVNSSSLVQSIVPDLVLRGVAAAYYRTLLK
ncbi:MAG: type III pantothenate kinase [Phycisphaerae bacterium]|nr:type III pantothenate kinase [Phycisphaerae bacterium]